MVAGEDTKPFCPVHNSRKFFAVLGVTSSYNLLHQRQHNVPPVNCPWKSRLEYTEGEWRESLQDDAAQRLVICADLKIAVFFHCGRRSVEAELGCGGEREELEVSCAGDGGGA